MNSQWACLFGISFFYYLENLFYFIWSFTELACYLCISFSVFLCSKIIQLIRGFVEIKVIFVSKNIALKIVMTLLIENYWYLDHCTLVWNYFHSLDFTLFFLLFNLIFRSQFYFFFSFFLFSFLFPFLFKATVMQIEKALINHCLRVSEVSWKFRILTIYNFAVIYLWKDKKVALKSSLLFNTCYCFLCL